MERLQFDKARSSREDARIQQEIRERKQRIQQEYKKLQKLKTAL